MNETRSNSRTKPMKTKREPLKEREMKSLKDSEKTNEYINIKTIINFDELYNIQNKAFEKSERLDLMLIRQFYYLADKCLFIIGPDASNCLEYYYMSHENYSKLRTSQQEYIKKYY